MGYKPSIGFLFLITAFLLTAFGAVLVQAAEKDDKPGAAEEGYEHDPTKEFQEFCEKQEELRKDPESIQRDCKRIGEHDFHDDDLRMLFSLFIIILWGAFVRRFLRSFKISLPYTVVLMLSGIIMGIIARYYCYKLYTFTAIARIKPEIILFAFLPILIFETAFSISSHVFLKACLQILLLAFPGMLLATALTAMLCYQFFSDYKWSFLQACFYGSIISATDPVAVVSILKEVGVAESLSVIVDGESLLNDGVAILLFEIFQDLLKEQQEGIEKSTGKLAGDIILMFFRIAVGGPVFGFISAKITIFCLSKIFNDAIVEITITLVSAYLTYYIAEDILGVSGVCAVVLLGITMSSEKTCISPDILEEVHEFWEMAAHLANTVLFVFTGIVISERGSRDLTSTDVYYLILLYFSLNFIRFIMLVVLSPLLSRCGYGLTWQNLIVMMWGGLRGGVGICLSLQVYEDTTFCGSKQLGPKILFHTAGIVLLTLLVNGTTTKKLLDLLGLTAITAGQREEMQVGVKGLVDAQRKAVVMLKHDRYLSDANWDYIYAYTEMVDPYANAIIASQKPRPTSSILSLHDDTNSHPCPTCNTLVSNEPSNEEYRVMTEAARLRVLKALKISYWKQFEQGVMSETAVKILVDVTDSFTDIELGLVHTKDLKKFWQVRGCASVIRSKMITQFGPSGKFGDKLPPKPSSACRVPFWWILTRKYFDAVMTLVVLLNMIPALWEFILDIQASEGGRCDKSHEQARHVFFILNWIFTTMYAIEFVCKIIGMGCKQYWSNKWNGVDFIVLLISILDLALSFYRCTGTTNVGFTKILKGLRLFRLIRSVRLIKPLIPAIIKFLNGRVHRQMFFGYDVAVGYLTATDDVLKYLAQMIENHHVAKKLRGHLERERIESLREIGFIQREHPGIAIAVKTRHAARNVLNQMRNALVDLRMDGLLDEKENSLLTIELEERMKRLWSSPTYIPPSSPEVLLQNLSWVYGNNELKDFIFSNAETVTFRIGDIIVNNGDEPNGIYVIITGLVKISFDPSEAVSQDRAKYGAIPNVEIFRDFEFDQPTEDFFTAGTVIGESGLLTRRPRSGMVECETDDVTAYFISLSIMDEAMEKFNDPYDSLESRLWRSCGIRRGTTYLPTTSFYQSWKPDKIQIHLERSCVPIGPQFSIIDIPNYVLDIFVIEGYVKDYASGDVFIAPSLVSKKCTKLICNVDNPKTKNRILLITQDKIGPNSESNDLSRFVTSSYILRRTNQKENKKAEEDEEDRGFKLHLNFNTRQKKRRKSVYVSDDEKSTKDDTIRRRGGDPPMPDAGPRRATPPPPADDEEDSTLL